MSGPRIPLSGHLHTGGTDGRMNMSNDSIVEEVRKIRDELSSKFDYDIVAILKDARKRQKRSGRKVVKLIRPKPSGK